MKICWDNLEAIYLTRRGTFSWKGKYRLYEKNCPVCKEDFLGKKNSIYCSDDCSRLCPDRKKRIGKSVSGEKNGNFGKSFYGKKNSNWKGGVTKSNKCLYKTYAHQIKWCEEVRNSPNNDKILEVKCYSCDSWFEPTRIQLSNRIQYLKGNYPTENRFYCSENCKDRCISYRIPSKYINNFETEWKLYKRMVKKFTRQTYKKYKNEINPKGLELSVHGYHLDHKFSIFEGFKNCILPNIIASKYNLEIIPCNENWIKKITCSVSKKKLFEIYK